MSLLVEYSIEDGKASEQIDALKAFVAALRQLGDAGFNYTAYKTDDPTKFVAVFDFDNDAAKQRFLNSQAFASYREGSRGRFTSPPSTTDITLVASTRS